MITLKISIGDHEYACKCDSYEIGGDQIKIFQNEENGQKRLIGLFKNFCAFIEVIKFADNDENKNDEIDDTIEKLRALKKVL